MQTVLITGGTGLVGKALTNVLLQKGYRIIVLTRDISGKQPKKNMSYALWDVEKAYIDVTAVKDADYIVHLAGAGVVDKKWTDAYKREIRESRTESSWLLIHWLKNNNNKVKAVISASAIGYYGPDNNSGMPFTETDKANDSFLGETCKLWEESIEPVTKLDKRLVKFRIGIVFSNDGGALAEFKKPIRFGIAAVLGSGKQMLSWIHINDLCLLFTTAIENDAMNGTYNAVAPQPVNNITLTLALAKKINGKFYIPFYVPAFFLKLLLGQRSIEVLKSATVSCKKIIDTGFQFGYDCIDNALDNLVKK